MFGPFHGSKASRNFALNTDSSQEHCVTKVLVGPCGDQAAFGGLVPHHKAHQNFGLDKVLGKQAPARGPLSSRRPSLLPGSPMIGAAVNIYASDTHVRDASIPVPIPVSFGPDLLRVPERVNPAPSRRGGGLGGAAREIRAA